MFVLEGLARVRSLKRFGSTLSGLEFMLRVYG